MDRYHFVAEDRWDEEEKVYYLIAEDNSYFMAKTIKFKFFEPNQWGADGRIYYFIAEDNCYTQIDVNIFSSYLVGDIYESSGWRY
jgi:hypothetical protein